VLKQEQTLVFKVVKKKALSARRNKQTADKSNVSPWLPKSTKVGAFDYSSLGANPKNSRK
jgi:hypothetical protein